MRNAQEQALALLAGQRGLVGPLELQQVEAAARGRGLALAEALVAAQLISPPGLAALLQELTGREFACPVCGRAVPWEGLSELHELRCPCGQPLVPRPRTPHPHQTARATSGFAPAFAPTGDAPARRTIGPYQVVRELGRGSNGIVFLAEKPGLERQFALKVLHESELGDEESVARFKLEAAIASKLDETGVIGVYDIGHDGRSWYYAMEYCPGETLEERISRGPLPPGDAAEAIAALARTMEQAHAQGVIHRDLKPANVILDARSGRPRITDFGLARDPSLRRALTRSGDVLGTPYYMAPEQLLNEGKIDHRIDVYALGVILYEALSGKRPYKAANFMELAERVRSHPPPPLQELAPEVPSALVAVCARAMARKRTHRYARAGDLADDLERFLRGDVPDAASRPSTELEGTSRTRLALLLPLVLGAAVLGGVGGAVLHYARRGPAPAPEQGPPPVVPPPHQASGGQDGAERAVREHLARAHTLDREGVAAERVMSELAQAWQAAGSAERLRSEVRLRRGQVALRRSHLTQALEDARALVEAGGEGEEGLEGAWLEAQALLRLDREADAIPVLERVARLDPQGPRGLTAAAIRLRLGGEGLAALAKANAATAKDPQFVPALVEQALLLLTGQRSPAEVAAPLRRAEQLDPAEPRVLLGLALLAYQHGSLNEAVLAPLETALRLAEPELDTAALTLRARVRLSQSLPERALEDLRAVVARRPQDARALFLRGAALWLLSSRREATEDWLSAWVIDPLACWGELLGLEPSLQAAARDALGIDPAEQPPRIPRYLVGPELRQRLERRAEAAGPAKQPLLEALLMAAEGRPWQELAPAFARAEAADPRSPWVAMERARVLVGRELFDLARGALLRARELGADGVECRRLEGLVWLRQGKRNEAVRTWEQRQDEGAEGLCAAALAAFVRQDEQGTQRLVDRIMQLDPDHVPTLLLMSSVVDPNEEAQVLPKLEQHILRLNGLIDGHVLWIDYHKAIYAALGGTPVVRGRTAQIKFTPETLRAVLEAHERISLVCRGAGSPLRAVETCLMVGTGDSPRDVSRRYINRARRYLRESLAREPERGEAWMWQGLWLLVTGAEKSAVLEAWRHARKVEPRIQLREDWIRIFGDRFKETDSLASLDLPVAPDEPPPEPR